MGREQTERLIIRLLTGVISLLLLWSLVWKPVGDWRALEHNRYQNAQSMLDWMQANESRARTAVKTDQGGARPSLLPVITRTAEAQGLSLNRLQPDSSGAVTVLLQAQSFNELMKWVHNLQENNGVTIVRISVDAQDQPGYINAQVRLQ